MAPSEILVGCCGFPVAMERYFQALRTVEVQQTFYDPPRPDTLEGWRKTAPPGFRFALKAWQVITHPAGSPTYRRLRRPLKAPEEAGYFRRSDTVEWAWKVTREAGAALEAEVLLFQCPASFTPSEENLNNFRGFFEAIDRGPFRLAWEPRGAWPADVVARLCEDLGLMHAVDPFMNASVTGEAYFRLHGRGGYRYSYTQEDLLALLDLCRPHNLCYVYFNNMTMFQDALAFGRMAQGGAPRGSDHEGTTEDVARCS